MTACGSRPAVSVLIPVHNALPFLRAALASVQAQTFEGLEVVVVDDASTDGAREWLARRRSPRFRYVRLRRRAGVAAARNRGLEAARGALVAFLDADDAWRPGYLQTLVPAFADRRVVVALSNVERIDGRGATIRGRTMRPVHPGLPPFPLMSASVVRRSAIEAIGGFDLAIRGMFEDLDFFCRLAHRYGPAGFHYVDRDLVRYRCHAAQASWALKRSVGALLARGVAASAHERRGLLDLTYIALKHRRWLSPGDRRRGGAHVFRRALETDGNSTP